MQELQQSLNVQQMNKFTDLITNIFNHIDMQEGMGEVGRRQEGWDSERAAVTIKHCSVNKQPDNR
jgi:hypothetical protein